MALSACGDAAPDASGAGTPLVVASIFPIGDLARRMAGEDVRVEVLLPARASPSTFEPAARQMALLNAPAAEAMLAAGARACTDITGYGIVGHGRNVARASGVTLRLRAADVPVFPGALELARKGLLSGGSRRGRESLGGEVSIGPGLEQALVELFFDAETSGGLLIAIHPERAGTLERELAARGVPVHAVGEFTERGSGDVSVELV